MRVEQLWRFPVKSMRGEQLRSATVTKDGIAGDRLIHVRNHHGVVTARTRSGLLGLAATTDEDGEVLVDGLPWKDPAVSAAIERVTGPGVEAVQYAGRERFDVMPLLVATDGGITAFANSGRRLRPNIVVGGVDGLAERDWPGRTLRIGEVVIGMLKLRQRCVVTTFDPDTGEQDLDVLRRINREFDGRVALDCWVERPGTISVGDPVEVVDEHLEPPPRGGWIVGAPYTVP
ncbi:MOSC N-terminal beta barrel domain-containing protein [Dactylosporangium sp. NPDC051484]|uniref:MOSC domain-containing protein n=1 Tax=Dactylosporangium sp. NPDC051484 TaxID=3154942 RepID=UPI003450DB8D